MEQEQQERLFEQACRALDAMAEDTSCEHGAILTNLRALWDHIEWHLDKILNDNEKFRQEIKTLRGELDEREQEVIDLRLTLDEAVSNGGWHYV